MIESETYVDMFTITVDDWSKIRNQWHNLKLEKNKYYNL